jgi:hypothetical protein
VEESLRPASNDHLKNNLRKLELWNQAHGFEKPDGYYDAQEAL